MINVVMHEFSVEAGFKIKPKNDPHRNQTMFDEANQGSHNFPMQHQDIFLARNAAATFITVLLFSVPGMATFKAGQTYQLKQKLTLVKLPEGPSIGPKSEATSVPPPEKIAPPNDEFVPYSAFWSLKEKKFVTANMLSPGLCELRQAVKSSAKNEILIKKGQKFTVSSPMNNLDASIAGPRNCMVMDAIGEGHPTKDQPQVQFQCCSEKELPTPASRQEFNELMQEKLKPLLKLVSER